MRQIEVDEKLENRVLPIKPEKQVVGKKGDKVIIFDRLTWSSQKESLIYFLQLKWQLISSWNFDFEK